MESIDLAPTFVEAAGGVPPSHITHAWREAVFSECDYAFRKARLLLG